MGKARIKEKLLFRLAAGRTVELLSKPQENGKPVKTAAVFFDNENSAFGSEIAREFRKKGILTTALKLSLPDIKGRKELERVKKLASAEAVVFATNDTKGIFAKAAKAVKNTAERGSKLENGTRLAMMWGIAPGIVKEVIAASEKTEEKTKVLTKKTFGAVKDSRKIRVTSNKGTDITFWLSNRMRWVEDLGAITKDYWGNMPAGEVFTAPLNAEGIAVIDGSVEKIGKISKTPITVEVRRGRAVLESVKCKNGKAKEKFLELLQKCRNSDRIRELGLGTNLAVKKVIGQTLVDEKLPGVHIAFGNPYPKDTGATWKSTHHYDCILQKSTIIVDGKAIMREGKSLLL